MLPLFRPKNDKDIGDKLVGKQKKYRLARNGSAVAVTGTLLAYYRRDVLPDGLMPPSGGRVELFAVIRTQAGRFFCYYIVTYPETEDIAGRQEYAHVCADFEAVRAFLGAMAYPGKGKFVDGLLAAAQQTLEILAGGGKVKKAAKATAKAAANAATEAGEAAGEPAGESAAAVADDETPSPRAAEAAQTPPPTADVGAAGATEAGEEEDVSAALARLVARARADIAREAGAAAEQAGLKRRPAPQADADVSQGAWSGRASALAETRSDAVQASKGTVAAPDAVAVIAGEPASQGAFPASEGGHAPERLISVADILADAPFQGGKKPKKASKRA
ncbi:MAG: hypothetical protein B193_3131 [Solidesulfovibrio magneticus str. Maddingley MBC34]|uniref:Uncharacterized protein n=1 Tax=Solidesulfovibrio magneticus str. Maddingley MBC34 TaxID=1206767 RepID=K6FHV5_9BACT|nr:MAG: hypothetical protein B193_3131 [Solidesulfovibrio magneticus str. Maddingley MBC34]